MICEGTGDVNFFKNLILTRGLPAFTSDHDLKKHPEASQAREDGGMSSYVRRLRSVNAASAYDKDPVDAVLLIADNDNDPANQFRRVRDFIRAARDFAVPDAPRKVAREQGRISTGILMLPWDDEQGQLETLCPPALREAWPRQAACADALMNCTGSFAGESRNLERYWTRVMLATVSADPNTPLAHAWSRELGPNLIPLNHHCFDRIAGALRQFAQDVQAE